MKKQLILYFFFLKKKNTNLLIYQLKAREVISIVKDLVLHIKNSGGGDQILEISTFDDCSFSLLFN